MSDKTAQLITAPLALADSKTLIHKAGVVVENGRILAVGPAQDLRGAFPQAAQRAFRKAVLTPGLVNPHVHLEYTDFAGLIAPMPFRRWLPAMIAIKRDMEEEVFQKGMTAGIRMLVKRGVTSVGEVATDAARSVRALEAAGLRYVCFQEVLASPFDDPVDVAIARTQNGLQAAREAAPQTRRGRLGIAPHAPYTVPRALMKALRRVFHRDQALPFAIHIAESRPEITLLRERAGPLLKTLYGIEYYQEPRRSLPLARTAVEFVTMDRSPDGPPDLLVHGNYLTADEMRQVAPSSFLVVCPGCRRYHCVRGNIIKQARASQIPVVLGTDSLASNDVLDPWSEMRRARRSRFPGSGASGVWEAATEGAARALGLEAGRLAEGLRADIAVFPMPGEAEDVRSPNDLLRRWLDPDRESPKARAVLVDGEDILRG